jgi:hypothetical protein
MYVLVKNFFLNYIIIDFKLQLVHINYYFIFRVDEINFPYFLKVVETEYIQEQIIVENITFRYFLFFYRRENLKMLMDSCKEFWSNISPKETKIIRNYERTVYYIWNFILINVTFTCTVFIINAMFVLQPPITANKTEIRILPFKLVSNIFKITFRTASYND